LAYDKLPVFQCDPRFEVVVHPLHRRETPSTAASF